MKLSMLTLNVGGLQDKGKLRNFILTARKWMKEFNIDIILIQEHNLHPSRDLEIQRISKGLKIIISYAPKGTDGNHWGGVMSIFSEDSTSNATKREEIAGSFLSTSFEWSASTFQISNVYAPVRPTERLTFFNTIKTRITNDMIMGGDWNCVPDVTLDVQSRSPLTYANIGGALLESIINDVDLIDIRREQLGNNKESTRRATMEDGRYRRHCNAP